MEYYRLRKNWNNGRWDSSQICAYTDKDNAIAECTQARIDEGYKVFDPDGNVIYPIYITEKTKTLLADGVIQEETEYWENIFKEIQSPTLPDLNYIIEKYSEMLNKTDTRVVIHNGIRMLRISPSDFKIKIVDKPKKNIKEDTYFNLGYFANFKENEEFFTLPVANLVADVDESDISSVTLKYLKERKVENGKVYFYANKNVSDQFKQDDVSTLIICKDNSVVIDRYNYLYDDEVKYAVSGAPIIIDGKQVTTEYKTEGWDDSIVRATYHGFLGVKDNYIYYFYLQTASSNCITSGEVYDKIKNCGFTDVIKVDGGGSFYCKISDDVETYTSENRQINNIGIVF